MITIIPIESPDDEDRWRSYVLPRATSVTDTLGWRAILWNAYRIEGYLFVALEDETTVGALGLYRIKHPIFGHYLTTAPFATDGGFFADTADAARTLCATARRLADELDVDYLLIRTREGPLDNFEVERRYVSAVVDLAAPDELWDSVIPAKTRNQVRKGRKSGFTVAAGPDEMEALFHVVHRHMRDLGSPCHSRQYYDCILRELPECTDVIVVGTKTEVVAGALIFYVNETAVNIHAVALRAYNRLCPNYLLYWTMLERAYAAGCHAFDMGRSLEGGSQTDFKRNWNPRIVSLSYNYYLRKCRRIPFLDPRNKTYAAAVSTWRRLPLKLTESIGHCLIRGLA